MRSIAIYFISIVVCHTFSSYIYIHKNIFVVFTWIIFEWLLIIIHLLLCGSNCARSLFRPRSAALSWLAVAMVNLKLHLFCTFACLLLLLVANVIIVVLWQLKVQLRINESLFHVPPFLLPPPHSLSFSAIFFLFSLKSYFPVAYFPNIILSRSTSV